ncbi:MAG: hypothetical protein A2942_00005 [Candidatus Lloydbacteria bacterium RIFCSPLOWO2_01_FULL_50_20]|uniref:Uncharacterized protein n=1 Tax=Candidatus Lloydbacteria bacterium RIFCSPLOWO2_01_FULL_50_20 TaxID=1798665 RepID=A0A1G2DGY7_9BACT|nr:MAG: hypothetical protein A3C13_03995 [Candidatus Lloydbacteria bacterium RIFCSPHIGHO2_02_FULL_50_11]OGZ12048.1 MAG: hypothetical protein A2942_00005 [Candidatus Lloydbacteria bacterium RIFCSPLOWO2_01_FULL_50_20]
MSTFTQQCIKEAKATVRKDSKEKSVDVRLVNLGQSWHRDCYCDAVKRVVERLVKQGFTAKMTSGENPGYHNCQEVYEYHYELGVHIEW